MEKENKIDEARKYLLENGYYAGSIVSHELIAELMVEYFKVQSKKTVTDEDNWISLEDDLPICLETGDWDGKRSDPVLIELKDGTYDIGVLYSGIMDGSKFNDWYSKNDYELANVIRWQKIKP